MRENVHMPEQGDQTEEAAKDVDILWRLSVRHLREAGARRLKQADPRNRYGRSLCGRRVSSTLFATRVRPSKDLLDAGDTDGRSDRRANADVIRSKVAMYRW